MQRYKIIIEYDGTAFSGWQKQPSSLSIQQCIEKAIYAFTSEEITVIAAGRTDTGVHALGQVAHFDLSKIYPANTIINAINFHLRPHKIVITNAETVDNGFHARFSAKKRYYRYIINNRYSPLALNRNRYWHVKKPLNLNQMKIAAQFLEGTHDFTSFRTIHCQSLSPIKTLEFITINKEQDLIMLDFCAKSFLHHMVRNITGTLQMVGIGKYEPEDIKLMLGAKDRSSSGITAPAHGLYFMKVEY
jgi:tRNA pseudouridine38-40 synthase